MVSRQMVPENGKDINMAKISSVSDALICG